MKGLVDIARHWSRQTEKGKGLRIDSDALDALNAIGVGEFIMIKAAEAQRRECARRIGMDIPGSSMNEDVIANEPEWDLPVRSIERSSREAPSDPVAAMARATRALTHRRKR